MTQPELMKYIGGLGESTREMYRRAVDLLMMNSHDTMSDDFQIAAAIVKVFEDLATRHQCVD